MPNEVIRLAHGAGGTLMDEAIMGFVSNFSVRSALGGVGIDEFDDGASLKIGEWELVTTMDGHTVSPIFFPGGGIGRLAVCGSVNDLAMMGAKPIAILDSIIVEEGFSFSDLDKITRSMGAVAEETGVAVIGGDFKVMPKNVIDKIIIATCGLGLAEKGKVILDSGSRPGDKVIVTGSIGEHGIALLSAREQFNLDTDVKSDVRPLWATVQAALSVGGITSMKDPTRGGLASALNDIAAKSKVSMWLDHRRLPIKRAVLAASEMLGLNPLEITCEGVAVMCVSGDRAEETLEAVRNTPYGREASLIGEVRADRPGYVLLRTEVGGTRIVDKPMGEPIPRVC